MDIQKLKISLEHIIEGFKREVASLRTGRATPALVEDIEVDCYGSKSQLKAVASIASPGPRELVIQPWDKSILPAIEKAIQASNGSARASPAYGGAEARACQNARKAYGRGKNKNTARP